MNQKQQYLTELAGFLSKQNAVMSGEELAKHLNRNGYRTTYGSSYKGGRGVYKLIRDLWNHHDANGNNDEAKAVAQAFVKPNGQYAYK